MKPVTCPGHIEFYLWIRCRAVLEVVIFAFISKVWFRETPVRAWMTTMGASWTRQRPNVLQVVRQFEAALNARFPVA